jgi:hypothetical protein
VARVHDRFKLRNALVDFLKRMVDFWRNDLHTLVGLLPGSLSFRVCLGIGQKQHLGQTVLELG